jgi:CRISPR/Cas system CSM-associated protein Csm4 (group 5 of RAMP superfamily)
LEKKDHILDVAAVVKILKELVECSEEKLATIKKLVLAILSAQGTGGSRTARLGMVSFEFPSEVDMSTQKS